METAGDRRASTTVLRVIASLILLCGLAGALDAQSPHYSITGDTISFKSGATGEDWAVLDRHPELKTHKSHRSRYGQIEGPDEAAMDCIDGNAGHQPGIGSSLRDGRDDKPLCGRYPD
jgi:hypothetical protein